MEIVIQALLCTLPVAVISLFWAFGFTKSQRKYMFWRADAKCEDCGRSWHDGYMLESHHIVPLSEGGANDVSNGKMLCRPDHAEAHENLAYDAKKRGDKKAHDQNAWSARSIRKKSVWRYGHEKE